MHPFRYALTRGPMILRAPENDEGFDLTDEGDDLDDFDDLDDADTDDTDDDSDDDEGGDEDADLDDAGDNEPPQRQSRGDNRVARATREASEARAENDRLKRELEALRRPAQPQGETVEQFNARLAQMEPWDRTEALRQRDATFMQQRLNQIEFNSNDNADKAAYDALAARLPIAAKLRTQVEERLANMRASGTTAPREVVLRYVIGDRQMANATRATNKTKKTAEARRAAQAARPTTGRGDQATEDRRGTNNSVAARNRRVESYEL